MFVKYSASTMVLCVFMLGYLYVSTGIEKPEIEVYFSEDTKELSSGDASFILSMKNLSSEQHVVFRLEKEIPDGWEANFCFNDLCFLNRATYTLKNREDLDILITITPDYDQKEEGKVKFLVLGDEIKYEKEFHVKTTVQEKKYDYTVTGKKEMEIEASKTAEFSLMIKNTGERDSYSLILEKNLPEGWKASLSEDTFTLEKNETNDIKIYITSPLTGEGGEEGSVSLRIIPENAEEKNISLTAKIKKDYDFQIRCLEPEKYAPKDYDVIFSMEIINTGNSKDTYYFETEEGILSEREAQLNPKEKYIVDVTVYSVQEDLSFTVTVRSGSGIEKETELSVKTGDLKRKVFAEMFTATWCTYCYHVEDAIEEMIDEYEGDVFCIQYHPGDSMKKPISEMRLSYYTFVGYPTIYFNGEHETVGGYAGVADKYRKIIEEELQKEDKFIIDLSYKGSELTIKITPLYPSSEGYDLYIVTYKDVEYKTKIYPNVAQDYVKKKIVLDEEKIVKINIDIEKGVVVFIQNRSIVDFENLELV